MSKYCPKHGSHNCQKCADEILALGIQCDKDRIATLTAELAEAREQRDSLRDECERLREALEKAIQHIDTNSQEGIDVRDSLEAIATGGSHDSRANIEPWYGHKFSQMPGGVWVCDCGYKLYDGPDSAANVKRGPHV